MLSGLGMGLGGLASVLGEVIFAQSGWLMVGVALLAGAVIVLGLYAWRVQAMQAWPAVSQAVVPESAAAPEQFATSPLPMYRLAPDGTLSDANTALLTLLGYATAAELHAALARAEGFYVAAGRRAELLDQLRTHAPLRDALSQVYHADGSLRWIRETIQPLYAATGSVVAYHSYVNDCTALYTAYTHAQQQFERMQHLFRTFPDTVLCVDPALVILDYKAEHGAADGPPDYIGKPLSHTDLFSPSVMAQLMQAIQSTFETKVQGPVQILEYQREHERGQRDYEARLTRAREDEVLILIRDISERKVAERLKNEFVSIVSHELRTPLTSIRGSLGLVCAGMSAELPPRVQELLNIAHRNSERLIELVNDMLDIDKIETGQMVFQMKPVEVVPLVDQVLAMNQAYARQYDVTFVLSQIVPEAQVFADPHRLMQVLTNLLSNAAKFSPTGGRVELAVQRVDQHIRLAMTDHGAGVPEEFRPFIFQRFAQADTSDTRHRGGSGLGLSISRAIVEQMHGRIGFTSEPHVATTFYVDLPEWRPVAPEVGLPRILIVEDTPDLAASLSIVLSHYGFAVDIAYVVEQARLLLTHNHYAAMTLDVLMPGQDGISFLRELRQQERNRTLPVVVVSAIANDKRIQPGNADLGVLAWLSKPVDPAQLVQILRDAIQPTLRQRARILHIEDDPDVRVVVAAILRALADVDYVETMPAAHQILAERPYDLVLLETECAGVNGAQSLAALRAAAGAPVPVVVFSVQAVGDEIARHVEAALIKSRTSNHDLIKVVAEFIQPHAPHSEPPHTAPVAVPVRPT